MKKEDIISLEQVAVNKLVYNAPIAIMPNRKITEYWSLDGILIARIDEADKFDSIINKAFGFNNS